MGKLGGGEVERDGGYTHLEHFLFFKPKNLNKIIFHDTTYLSAFVIFLVNILYLVKNYSERSIHL